ncbi:hypothetical protein AAG570_007233 [Ranatra chinensis]|uniref:C2H2-type domain-containing protein n=1 Tax=Ranatra chinensis TaxID=642074 RepID=A0ABD0XV97_9HEMI
MHRQSRRGATALGTTTRRMRTGLCSRNSLKALCEKSSFFNPLVRFMGHVLSREGIHPDPGKVEAIRELQEPVDVKGVLSIMGLVGYNRSCLLRLADRMERWNSLTKKGSKFVITEDMREALEWAKTRQCEDPFFLFLDFSLPYVITTDASQVAMGTARWLMRVNQVSKLFWELTSAPPAIGVDSDDRRTGDELGLTNGDGLYSRGWTDVSRLPLDRRGVTYRLMPVENPIEQDQSIEDYPVGKANHRRIREAVAHLHRKYYWTGTERTVTVGPVCGMHQGHVCLHPGRTAADGDANPEKASGACDNSVHSATGRTPLESMRSWQKSDPPVSVKDECEGLVEADEWRENDRVYSANEKATDLRGSLGEITETVLKFKSEVTEEEMKGEFRDLTDTNEKSTIILTGVTKVEHTGEGTSDSEDCRSQAADGKKRPRGVHRGEKPFQCDQCDYKTDHRMNFKYHKMRHSGEKPFRCDQCDYGTVWKSHLNNHRKTHSSEKPFQCDQCDFKTSQRTHLKHHKMRHSGERPFVCDQCDYGTVTKASLNFHMRKHSSEKPFQCDQCDYKTDLRTSLKYHKMIHSGERPFLCDQCDYSTVKKASLNFHMKTHSSEKPFQCDQCDYKTDWRSSLKNHIMSHRSEKPFRCDQCDFGTVWKSSLNIHMKTHSSEKPFQCDQCDYKTGQRTDLKNHKMRHSGEKPFLCDQCDYRTVWKASLNNHKKTHGSEKQFLCDQCDYKTNRKMSFKYHKMRHSGERPFVCDQCDYGTVRMSDLKCHKMRHTGEKPFLCDQCDYKTSQRALLKHHKMRHSGERPFVCDQCDYGTVRMADLNIHMKTHNSEKPFQCDQCDYKTDRRTSLKYHIKSHSSEKPFQCDQCDYRGLRMTDLKSHKKVHSGETL